MKFLTLITSLLVTSTTVFAVESADVEKKIADIEKQWATCLESPDGQSTVGMNGCGLEANEAADTVLNELYQQMIKGLNADINSNDQDTVDNAKEVKGRLVAAQRAWITFRDTNCYLVGAQMLGGTGEGTLTIGCIAQTTIDRVKELNSIL